MLPWLNENWHPDDPPPNVDAEKWKQLIGALIAHETGKPPAMTPPEIWKVAESMVDGSSSNPLSAFLVGIALPGNYPERKELLDAARKGLAAVNGGEILTFHATLAWASTADTEEESDPENAKEKDANPTAKADDESPAEICLSAMARALEANEGFSKFDDRLAGYLLVEGAGETLLEADPEGFFSVVSACASAKPWMKKWVEGKMYHRIAWGARGGGYWSSVSDEGRTLFPRNIEKANRALEEAWEMEPGHPGVAADGIAIAMARSGSNDQEHRREMLKWFERMNQLEIDYADGYTNVLWGFRKRWHGELETPVRFGEECLRSGRFDSNAPWFYLQSLRDYATEWDLPSNMFPKFREVENLIQLFEGAESAEERALWRRHDRTEAAVALAQCWEYEEAAKWIERLGSEPMDPLVLQSWNIEEDSLREKIALFSAPENEALRKAEKSQLQFQSGPAADAYKAALEKTDLAPVMRKHLQYQYQVARIEYEFSSKGKVGHFGPDGEEGGWLLEYAVGLDGAVAATGKNAGYFRATCEAKIGPDFQLEGKVKTENAAEGLRTWISFGYPEWSNKERWSTVSFVRQEDQGAVLLANALNTPEEVTEMKLPDEFEFRLQVSRKTISLWVDGKPVWDHVAVPSHFVQEGHSRVGLGGIFGSDRVGVQFEDLRLTSNR
ncbi:MAG: hypothetical protein KDN19_17355 [Verrucomicrobiae bacterium]|nr:hypothetical protein [Verrucomicrobiae bacterium]